MASASDRDQPPGETADPDEPGLAPHEAITRDEVKHRSLAGVFFLTFSSAINLVVGFGSSLVLARLLTPEDFGVVAVGTTAMLLGNALADGGLGAGMVQRREPPTRAELRTMNGLQLSIALVVCLPVAAVALTFFSRAGAITALMILSLPLTALQTPGRITLTRSMRYDRQVIADTGSMVIAQVLTVVAVVLGAGVWGLAAGAVTKALVGTVMVNCLSGGFYWPSLRGWRKFGKLLLFGVKFQASFYAFLGREQGLNVLLATTAGLGPLGIWTFTNRIFQFPSLMFNSLYVVGFPAMANFIARGEEIGPVILRTVRRAAILGTFVFATFAAASPKLISALFGEQWADAASIVPFICLSTLMLGSVAVAATSYLPAVGRPGIVAVASVCLGVVWLVGTAVLYPSLGVMAIGIANLFGAVAEMLVLNEATRRSSGVAPYRPLMRPLGVALLSGGIGLLVCSAGPTGFVTAVSAGALTCALSALGLWLVCRSDLKDSVGLAFGALRSAVPRLRRTSPQAT